MGLSRCKIILSEKSVGNFIVEFTPAFVGSSSDTIIDGLFVTPSLIVNLSKASLPEVILIIYVAFFVWVAKIAARLAEISHSNQLLACSV